MWGDENSDVVVERDVPVTMDDGVVLRADVFRPRGTEPAPAIMVLGPYGKGVRWTDTPPYSDSWESLVKLHPDVLEGSTHDNLTWETVDPEIWVAWGYAVVRVDARGAGRSPGYLDPFSARENRDFYESIEWAAAQPWCNGKVGLCGISYYAINQWSVASLQPPHLAAMIPWEGAADAYRDVARHGGIASNVFLPGWWQLQLLNVQHGNPDAPMDPWLGQRSSGPEQLSEPELAANRVDIDTLWREELDGPSYRERSATWPDVTVPFLSAASWGGFGLHARGNFEAFTQAASGPKWLEVHPGRHEEWFYLPYGLELQRRFLDHFLKDIDNGWDQEPPVRLNIRRPFTDEAELRKEHEWPLARTRWTKLYFDGTTTGLNETAPANSSTITFRGMGEPITVWSAPLPEETELTGPLAATLHVSSSTIDADLFLTLRAFDPEDQEVDFQGSADPRTPLAQGWLRASHRKLDAVKSTPYRPYHTHDEKQPLEPDTVYEVQVEIWPTCIVLPAGYRLALTIGGQDFARETPEDGLPLLQGSSFFLHTDPVDRPAEIFDGTTTIHTGPTTPSHLLLPIIPTQD